MQAQPEKYNENHLSGLTNHSAFNYYYCSMPRSKTESKAESKVEEKTTKKPLTVGDLTRNLSQIKVQQLLYVVLLVAFLAIGYLLARVQTLEKGGSAATGGTAPETAAQAPAGVPDPKVVLEKLKFGSYPVKGDKNAKVKIVEFADFRCPYCASYYTDTETQIMKEYVDTGKVAYYFRDYAFLGPASTVAANAAQCANEQGKFWEMHEWLYTNQPSESDTSLYTTEKMTETAGTIGLDTAKFSACLSSNKFDKNVQQDLADGQEVGVSGTPTFYINGRQLVGAVPFENFKTIIEEELAK